MINLLVILYNVYASYINAVLKEYHYLFLYNNNRFQDKYEFKNSNIYFECEKKHNKRKLVGQIIDNSCIIKCLSLSYRKEIKINALLKIKKSISIPDYT